MKTFADLVRLADKDPKAYINEVAKMRLQDPERYAQFIEHLRAHLNKLAENKYVRRHSSIQALLVGDVRALENKRRNQSK